MGKNKRYEKYKDSGTEWIGQVPEHWNEGRVSQLCKLGRGRVISKIEIDENLGPYPVYSSQTENNGILGCINTFDFNGEYVTWTTDGANAGTVFKRSGKFNCTNVCGTLKTKLTDLDLSYLAYSLSLETKKNVRIDINPKLMNNQMARIRVLLPLFHEQLAIANFLDHKTSEIDALIADKEKLIELLKEQRQAIITEAVTKGLNPDVKMKDSGVEWIGDVPEHWEVTKVRYFYDICLGKMVQPLKQNPEDTFEPYLCSVNVNWEGINVEDIKYMWLSPRDKEKYAIQSGDLIVNEGGDAGRTGIWEGQISECYIQNAVHRVRGKKGNLNKYLYYWLYTLKHVGYIELLCNKATIMHFTAEKFKNLLLIMPPTDEQLVIVKYVDNKIETITSFIQELHLVIQKLKEYRQSLIYEAVTGKIDVRDWADKPFERGDAVANA